MKRCNICGRDYDLGGRAIGGVNFCGNSCKMIYDGRIRIIYSEEFQKMMQAVRERVKKECTV